MLNYKKRNYSAYTGGQETGNFLKRMKLSSDEESYTPSESSMIDTSSREKSGTKHIPKRKSSRQEKSTALH